MGLKWTPFAVLALALLAWCMPARAEFMAVRIAEQAKQHVVTIEAVSLSLASVSLTSRQQRIVQSYNTGLILTKSGFILTDASALSDVQEMEVTLSDGRKYPAEIIVKDDGYGLGLIKLKKPPSNLKPAKLAIGEKVNQGDPVVVVGNAGGYGNTVSFGIVSALRTVRLRSGQLVPDMIQSDVVINSGNEGSPLFNAKGDVIGIQAVFGGGGALAMQNVNFFMPASLVKRVADQLMATSKPAFRPFLGIQPYSGSFSARGGIAEVTDDLKMYMNLPDEYWDVGMLIYNVWEGSPAYEGGLRYQDFVVKVNGDLLKSIGQLEKMVYNAKKGQQIIFGIIRRDRFMEIEVGVGDHPKDTLDSFI
jgi:S1-C subfamily serine protease